MGWGGHPVGGLPHPPPPNPEKPNFSHVGSCIAWSSGRVGTFVRILVGFRLEGGMNLGE